MPSPEERRAREAKRREQALFRVRLGQAYRGQTVIVWAFAAILTGFGLLIVGGSYFGAAEVANHVVLNGALMPERIVHGEWWRLLSGPMLHRDLPHLLVNLVGLLLIGRHVELAFGRSGFISLYLGASIVGAVGSIAAGHVVSVGASGAIFGLIGGFVAVGVRLWRRLTWQLQRSLVGLPLVLVCGLLLLGGIGDDGARTTDVAAHAAGTVAGFMLGLILPLNLRDFENEPLVRPASRWSSRALLVVALLLTVAVSLALSELVQRADQAPSLLQPPVRDVMVGSHSIVVPTGYRTGVWRSVDRVGTCEGQLVDAAWTLLTRRVACFDLPVAGTLLLGRPDQLMTMDAGDHDAMARAWRERRFVWRQANVLIAPAGGGLLYVVRGHQAMLAGYAASLAHLLPPPGDAPWHSVPLSRGGATMTTSPQESVVH